jgi:tetratricopeptide (TPR) repeat protein
MRNQLETSDPSAPRAEPPQPDLRYRWLEGDQLPRMMPGPPATEAFRSPMSIDFPVGPATGPARPAARSSHRLVVLLTAISLALLALTPVGCSRDVESRLAEIRALQQGGEFEASIEPIRVLLHSEPSQPEGNYRLGIALVQTGRKGLAIWPLQKASQTDEYGVQAGLMLAQLLVGTKDYEEAIRTADQVLARDPSRVGALYVRGEANIGAARPEEALNDAARILELRPDDYQAFILKVAALVDLDRYEEAEAAYIGMKERAEEIGDPDRAARACALLGSYYASQKIFDQAEKEYDACLARYPAHPILMQWATNFYNETEKPERAVGIWTKAVEDVPEDFNMRASLADLYLELGDLENAERVLSEAVVLFDTVAAWQALSAFYRKTGNPLKAREALENALDRAPGEPEALRFALADLLVLEGDLERAAEIAAGLKEPAYRNMVTGSIRLKRSDPKGALEIFEAGLRLWPNNAGARFLAGQAAEQMGDTKRAMAEYREAIRVDETATDASLLLAKIHFSLAEWEPAQQFAERHIRVRPYSGPEAHMIAARAAGAQGNYEVGVRLLEGLRARAGDGPVPRVELARLLRASSGNQAAADSMLKSGLDLNAIANLSALRSLVQDLLALERADEALALIDQAIAANTPNTELLNLKGRVLVGLGRVEEGKATLEAAVQVDATRAGQALQELASIAVREGDLEAALTLANNAVSADPEDPESRYLAAQISAMQGQPKEAMRLLRATLRLEPGHPGACNDLAWRLTQSDGDLNEALELAERATRIAPNWSTYDTLGWVQLHRGSVNAAVEAFESSLKLKPEAQSTQYHLALAVSKQGDRDRAVLLLKTALDTGDFAEQKQAKIELARLESR